MSMPTTFAQWIESVLMILLIAKFLLLIRLLMKRPQELKRYPRLQRLKMAIPFGFGRRVIRPEDWPVLKDHHGRRQMIIYLMLFRIVVASALAVLIRMNWVAA